MKNILITGGNGYVAKSLHKGLSEEFNVTSIKRNDFDMTDYNSLKTYLLSKVRFDVIIHTAIVGGSRLKTDSFSVVDSNLQMYYNLLQNKHLYGKLISFGSGAEIHNKNSPYGLSKSIISESIKLNDECYNLRIYAVFDENEIETRFIKSNIKRYINREPMIIHGDKKMDFFYMKDLIKLVSYYINEKNPPKELDCKYNYDYTLNEILKMINNISDYRVECIVENKEKLNDYIGVYTELPIEYIGLIEGIYNTYNIIKKESL